MWALLIRVDEPANRAGTYSRKAVPREDDYDVIFKPMRDGNEIERVKGVRDELRRRSQGAGPINNDGDSDSD